jgi:hypothetical protein
MWVGISDKPQPGVICEIGNSIRPTDGNLIKFCFIIKKNWPNSFKFDEHVDQKKDIM